MSNPLLDVKVRPDWQLLSQRMTVRRLRQWHAAEAAVALAAMLSLLAGWIWADRTWIVVVRSLLFTAVLWLIPLAFVYRSRLSSDPFALQLADAAIVLTLASALALVSSPAVSSLLGVPALGLLAIAVPLVTLPWLIHTARRYPIPARRLGLIGNRWLFNLIAGIGLGLALGLHMLLTGRVLLAPETQPGAAAANLVWLIFARAGLQATGQELFFRGWCYRLLRQQARGGFWNAAVKITLLNLLVYATTFTATASPMAVTWVLAYGALIALANTWMRHRFHSLVPGLACNVVAGAFLLLIGGA